MSPFSVIDATKLLSPFTLHIILLYVSSLSVYNYRIDALQGNKKKEEKSTPQRPFDGFRPMPCLLHCLRSRKHTGIAQDQNQSGRRKSRRPSRREVMDEVSRQTAMRLQAEKDHRAAMVLSNMSGGAGGEGYESYHSYGNVNLLSDDDDGNGGGSAQYPPTSAGQVGENDEAVPPPETQTGRDATTQQETNEFVAYCNYCDKSYPFFAGGGYGTLHRHLKAKHPIEYGTAKSQIQLNFSSGASETTGTPLIKYDHKVAQDAMVRWAAMKHLPFNFFDDKKYEVTMQTAFNVGAKRIPATSHQKSNNRQFFEKQK
ncbi:uncharacterized protein LOC125187188 isoform X2 [Salvia hispanica]|uniref:uncharacterized protein LOC125187188 isoform X2 n=1 Tax=Salvia hispanica TaxID=49212 RepID=UPI00200938D5|nr:uncharacterized protein LOC125187188 isoform X2 [Salvia hispanica]